ncbi:hypothetical protein CL621_02140 [archaeon]|nr:hypothetical protein [archaeon]|tara:strand:+ start:363 stop:1799 length:1437 start_codon:yes stop_codon:yes gene_type:complete
MHLGKSVKYLGIANLMFYFFGYLTYLILGRVLGPAKFGIYGIIISLVTVVNMVVARGFCRAVTKFISEKSEKAEIIKRNILNFQVVMSLVVFALFFIFAKWIALLFNDISLTPYIRIASFAFISFPLYSIFVAYISGLKKFKQQAILHGIYSILKFVLIIGLVLIWHSILWGIIGFVLSSTIMFILCFFIYGLGKKEKYITIERTLKFAVPITILGLFTLLLPETSLYLIKSLSESGISNTLAGYYTAISTIAKTPLYFIFPLSIVLFPLISESTAFKNTKRVRTYIKSGLRYSLMILVPLTLLISATSKEIIKLLYSETFIENISVAPTLSILIIGLGFFALFNLFITIISGSGKPKISMFIGGIILILNIILNFIFIPQKGLVGAALATSISVFIGFVISSVYIIKKFNVFTYKKSIIKIMLSGFIIYFVAKNYFLVGGFWLIIKYLIIAVMYILLLIILKELKKKDFIFFRKSLF